MRALILWLLMGCAAFAQGREVRPGDVELTVTMEDMAAAEGGAPYAGEMVLLTIHGIYRRHIARETLAQPELEGFAWMQLGEDQWYETRERGQPVKNFRRRMALFPEAAGELEVAAFTHHLTLIDENDGWFDHDITSPPVRLSVRPAPESAWWFPARRLAVSDSWSNAPDQLDPGAGVLRIVRVAATGAAPQMIPPMPELRSPSGLVFAHPEQRLVELSPEGPVSVAYWRWTIQPGNGVSAITEPMEFEWYDAVNRQSRRVRIGAQRVAYTAPLGAVPTPPEASGVARGGVVLGVAGAGLVLGLVLLLWGRHWARPAVADPLRWQIRRAARAGDLAGLRRAGAALVRRGGAGAGARAALHRLDGALFGKAGEAPDPGPIARALLARSKP
ncbi:MAG: BatD family protein [Vannielia sp.]|uniref:hypothetical protein n=1 Tax=Vannielia sp. TaxID=2813045 RepID=UPI003B8B8C10